MAQVDVVVPDEGVNNVASDDLKGAAVEIAPLSDNKFRQAIATWRSEWDHMYHDEVANSAQKSTSLPLSQHWTTLPLKLSHIKETLQSSAKILLRRRKTLGSSMMSRNLLRSRAC